MIDHNSRTHSRYKGRTMCQHISLWLICCLMGVAGSVYAQGYGVNSTGDDTAKINALLNNVEQTPATQNSAPASQPVAQAHQAAPEEQDPVGGSAFATMTRNMLPLTPDQIRDLRYLYDRTQSAAAEYPGTPPKPTSTSMIVKLSPGAAPPIVRLQQGYVTSLVFVDASGASWPIQAYDLGDQKNFNVQWDKKGNTLMVQALSRYQSGNMAVMLRGLNTPIMVTLMPGQRAVDYRVDLRIPKLGPNANTHFAGLPGTESEQLISVLDGVPPEGARALQIVGADDQTQAWLIGKTLYLRTGLTLLSPAYVATMSSSDGTHAYQLPRAPVILALWHGKTVTLTIKGL